jgi:uncharacterized protein
MDKQFYVLYLIPSRPDFAQTMNDEEKSIMFQHVNYWQEHMKAGKVIVFGPVFEPAEAYGLGIIAVNSEKEVKEFIDKDPAIQINRYEYYPIKAIVRP